MTEIRKLEPLPIEREDCCVELDDLRERAAKARLEGMEEAARICDEYAKSDNPRSFEGALRAQGAQSCAAVIRAKAKESNRGA